MKIVFWFFSGLILFIYFIYPVVIFIIARLKGKEPGKDEITPAISLIIPVYNEEKVIRDKVRDVLSLDYPHDKLEILFALDGCTDRTKDILTECGDSRLVIIDGKKRQGKVNVLNKAIARAKGDIVVFSDANSMHKPDMLRKLVRNFSDEQAGCVCGRLRYTDTQNTFTGKAESLYWRYEHFLKRQESRLGKLLITNGSIQAIRKKLYPYPDPEVADDFSLPIITQASGYKVLYEPEAVVYESATQNLKEEFSQKVRIISQGIKGVIILRKELLKLGPLGIFEFLFHKLLRWFAVIPLMIILLFSIILINDRVYLYLFIAQVLFYMFALIGFYLRNSIRLKIFYIPFYFCLVNLASMAAVYNFLRKGQTRTWEKAYSTRRGKVGMKTIVK